MKKSGFALAEVLVALFVLSVALLGSTAALHYGLRSAGHGALVSEANTQARMLLELMLSENRAFASPGLPVSTSGTNDLPGVTRPLNDPPFGLTAYRLDDSSRFRRHIEVRNYRAPSETDSSLAWKDDVREVRVEVSWQEGTRLESVSLFSFSRRPR